MTAMTTFDAAWDGNVLVWNCHGPLSSLTEADPTRCLEPHRRRLADPETAGIVVDLGETPYVGSLMLESLRLVWNELSAHGKTMALCNVQEVARDILRLARFDVLWPICDTRQQAIDSVRGHAGSEQFSPRDVLA